MGKDDHFLGVQILYICFLVNVEDKIVSCSTFVVVFVTLACEILLQVSISRSTYMLDRFLGIWEPF